MSERPTYWGEKLNVIFSPDKGSNRASTTLNLSQAPLQQNMQKQTVVSPSLARVRAMSWALSGPQPIHVQGAPFDPPAVDLRMSLMSAQAQSFVCVSS
jgi:hypothetical protein